jgi:acylphosphatase
MKAVKISVRGKVQGVFFRKFTKMKAESLGLVGFVRNEKDGSVWIEVCGTNESISTFIQWCHEGSPMSLVDEVSAKEVVTDEFQYDDFKITH